MVRPALLSFFFFLALFLWCSFYIWNARACASLLSRWASKCPWVALMRISSCGVRSFAVPGVSPTQRFDSMIYWQYKGAKGGSSTVPKYSKDSTTLKCLAIVVIWPPLSRFYFDQFCVYQSLLFVCIVNFLRSNAGQRQCRCAEVLFIRVWSDTCNHLLYYAVHLSKLCGCPRNCNADDTLVWNIPATHKPSQSQC